MMRVVIFWKYLIIFLFLHLLLNWMKEDRFKNIRMSIQKTGIVSKNSMKVEAK